MTVPTISPPRRTLPKDACDSHAHIFGPFEQFPVPEGGTYTPPLAPEEAHRAMLEQLGFDRAVIVQASAYGTDNRCLLDALGRQPETRRGVAVINRSFDDPQLRALRAGGVRGARFTEILGKDTGVQLAGASGFDELTVMAPRMRAHGLHAQLFTPLDTLADWLDRLLALDVTLVLDHMARVGPSERTVDDRCFQRLLALLREGRVWIKLIVFRNSRRPGDYEDVRPFHDAMIEANPDRLLWGTDWPFLNSPKLPDPGAMLDLFDRWTGGDEGLRRRILVDNPATLYDFLPSD